jgi:hypothetical protein
MSVKQKTEPNNYIQVLVVSVLLGFVFQLFYYGHFFGIQTPIFVILINLAIKYFADKNGRYIQPEQYFLAATSIIFASFVAIFDAASLIFFDLCMSYFSLVLLIGSFISPKLNSYRPLHVLVSYVVSPVMVLIDFFKFWPDFIGKSNLKKHSLVKNILLGLIISLPLLIVFLVLFTSADQVFGNFVSNLFDIESIATTLGRSAFWGFGLFCALGSLYLVYESKSKLPFPSERKNGYLNNILVTTTLSSLNILFLSFIVFQLKYLFGGKSIVLNTDISYADYARSGFFQLVFIALLTFVIVWMFDAFLERKEAKVSISNIASIVLIAQVFVIIASSLKRLDLYEQSFGFTVLRLYSHGFVFFVAVALLVLACKILIFRSQAWLTRAVLLVWVLFMFGINIINPHAFIANKNIQHFEKTKKIDINYITSLSKDATEQKIRIIKDPNIKSRILSSEEEFSQEFNNYNEIDYLSQQLKEDFLYDNKQDPYSWSLARSKTNKLIQDNKKIILENTKL